MKFWICFFREKKIIILLYLATVLLFLSAGCLWHMENLGHLLYIALLTLVVWGITGIACGLKYVHRCRELEKVVLQFEKSGELALSESDCRDDKEAAAEGLLKELLLMSDDSRRKERDKWEEKAANQKDYYVMWTHQIKTPISALKLLLEKNTDCRDVFLMREELFKIEQYVEMVLTYQRLDNMASDMVLQEYELVPLLRQAVRKYSVLFINKGLNAEVPDTEAWVLTDKKWFSFCLEQILSNSIKYTVTGGVRFLVEEGERDISLTLEDTGIGIRAEDLPRIFEKGFTGYNGRLDKKSTGIGLYLCRQILGYLGSSIRAESEVGIGTRMLLTIPKSCNERTSAQNP